jgi:hypothetical protein
LVSRLNGPDTEAKEGLDIWTIYSGERNPINKFANNVYVFNLWGKAVAFIIIGNKIIFLQNNLNLHACMV